LTAKRIIWFSLTPNIESKDKLKARLQEVESIESLRRTIFVVFHGKTFTLSWLNKNHNCLFFFLFFIITIFFNWAVFDMNFNIFSQNEQSFWINSFGLQIL